MFQSLLFVFVVLTLISLLSFQIPISGPAWANKAHREVREEGSVVGGGGLFPAKPQKGQAECG